VLDAITYFNEAIDSKKYSLWPDLVTNWSRMEKNLGYPARNVRSLNIPKQRKAAYLTQSPKHSFSKVARPLEVAYWLKCGRKYSAPPVIHDLPLYASHFTDWWSSAQPKSRGEKWPLSRDIEPNELSDRLAMGGLNGIIMVLIALTWWYQKISSEDEKRDFSAMLDDVSWVVGKLATSTKRQKRTLDEETDTRRKR
jgi:hypothetical protein